MCSWFLVCVCLHGTEIADHESILITSMIVRSKAILMPYKSANRIEQPFDNLIDILYPALPAGRHNRNRSISQILV